ncbi:gamma-glutamylcyclotransferase family protein [uncultured Kordia sp.]|uniref:gamma-glutamylcyclotransferase family protein n=1 Tax=uncultured Kordia sp. TaxID=507699 RepID=UPI00260F2FAA|nr:gamma-glutamylcyclotransferase family protein [uncultured Kordia sp.]
MKNYIFGYGSLIETQSRLRDAPMAKVAFPAIAFGFQRGWYARMPETLASISPTYLGCYPDRESHVNGVIYEVTDSELEATDGREKGYTRKKVTHIEEYYKILEPGDTVWIYVNDFSGIVAPPSAYPSKDFPIVQSYVDICINGCLEIENSFPKAKEDHYTIDFIRSTIGWSECWANDRIYPRRPFIYEKNAFAIDKILKENLPECIYDNIYIE